MKNILIIGLFIFAFVSTNAQEVEKKSKKELKAEKEATLISQTKKLIEVKAFTFTPKSARPLQGKTIHISNYLVRIKNDSIFSYLPFYGRAYNTAYGSSTSPFHFTLPVDSYSSEETKKGFRIKIGIKTKTETLGYTFNVSETGTTSLNVDSSNRQSISYSGELDKFKK